MLRLNEATITLLDQYPTLAEGGNPEAAFAPTEQKIDAFFANFERIHARGAVGAVTCEAWAKFAACLMMCSGTRPVIYWPYAYLCACEFCEDACPEIVCDPF